MEHYWNYRNGTACSEQKEPHGITTTNQNVSSGHAMYSICDDTEHIKQTLETILIHRQTCIYDIVGMHQTLLVLVGFEFRYKDV